MINRIDEYIRMSEVEENHWWYKSLHNLVLQGIKDNFNSYNISIIDAGCGTGGTIRYLVKSGYNNIIGFDVSEVAVQISRDRNLNVFQEDIRNINRTLEQNGADVIICNDVLYFFNESERSAIIKNVFAILKTDGILIMNFPALNMFRGIHDEAVGIENRFSVKDVEKSIDKINWKIIKMIYWPFLLSPIVYIARLLQKLKLKILKNVEIKSDLAMPNKLINDLLFRIVLAENSLLKVKPFGSSLFIILKKLM